MSFHYFDILQVLVFLVLCFTSYKLCTNKKFKTLGVLWLLAVITFFNMPVVTENNQSQVLFTAPPQVLPEKVEYEKKSFEDKHKEDLEKLRKENKQTEENL